VCIAAIISAIAEFGLRGKTKSATCRTQPARVLKNLVQRKGLFLFFLSYHKHTLSYHNFLSDRSIVIYGPCAETQHEPTYNDLRSQGNDLCASCAPSFMRGGAVTRAASREG
jgi:hypothetical protein